jgi:L-iditol 2-dehydrogenase
VKALLLSQYKNVELTAMDEPAFAANEVLVRVRACGICGSDIHGYDGSTGRRIPPLVMGHEAAGEVAALGSSVQGWQVGERVTFDSTISCGICAYCRQGLMNLCDNRRVIGVSCDEYRRHGAFAEYVAVPEHILYRIPDGVSDEQAAMVEPVSIAFHAANLTPMQINDTAVIVGAGMIGLLLIQTLRLAGCGQIIAVDVDPARLAMAERFGADLSLPSDTDEVRQAVYQHTHGRGADIAFDVVGINPAFAVALASLKKGGRLTLVGNLSPKVDLPLQQVVTRQVALQGSCASNGEYGACLDMIRRGAIQVDPIISAVAPLEEGAQWFERLYNREGNYLKVILRP